MHTRILRGPISYKTLKTTAYIKRLLLSSFWSQLNTLTYLQHLDQRIISPWNTRVNKTKQNNQIKSDKYCNIFCNQRSGHIKTDCACMERYKPLNWLIGSSFCISHSRNWGALRVTESCALGSRHVLHHWTSTPFETEGRRSPSWLVFPLLASPDLSVYAVLMCSAGILSILLFTLVILCQILSNKKRSHGESIVNIKDFCNSSII